MFPTRFLRAATLVIGHWALFVATAPAADRIVTLGGAVTETVFALGAGAEVVARDTSSVYPPAVHALPNVGYFRTIGAEGVLSQSPTLILAATGTGPERQVELLKNSGVRFVHLAARPTAESTFEMITAVGAALDRTAAAAALTTQLRAQFAEAATLAAAAPRPPRVVILMGVSAASLQAAYDGTAASALIALGGGVNPFSGHSGYKTTSAEELIAADPDFIFIATRDPGAARGTAFTPLVSPPSWLATTRAATSGRLLTMDMTLYLVFGPRSGDAVLTFARTIHAP